MTRADERMFWVMEQTIAFGKRGFLVAWDEDVVDDFVEKFPEAEKTLRAVTRWVRTVLRCSIEQRRVLVIVDSSSLVTSAIKTHVVTTSERGAGAGR